MRKSWKKGIALAVACALVACNSTATGNVANAATKYVSLNKTSLKLAVKKTAKLTVKKKGGVKVKSTTFKSSNAKVASVTKKGVVTGKSEGTAKITVKVKFKKGKKSGSSTLIAKVTVGNTQVSATPKTSSAPSQGISNTTNNKTNTAATPTTTTGASATATAKVTATATPAVKATKTPGAEDPKGTEKPEKTTKPTKAPEASEDPEGTEKPEKTTKPTKAPQGTEDPEATEAPEKTTKPTKTPVASEDPEETDEPTKTTKPTKTPVATEDPEETDGPAETPKPSEDPDVPSGSVRDEEGNYYKAGLYDYTEGYDDDDEYYIEEKLVHDWSYLVKNKIVTVSNNTLTKVDFSKIDAKELIIDKSVTAIGQGAFKGCEALDRVDTQDYWQVISIGDQAFMDSSVVDVPIYADKIGKEAFKGCSNLYDNSFLFGKVESIGEGAFAGCNSFFAVTIPKTTTSIGKGAFDKENLGIYLSVPEMPEGFVDGWYDSEKNIRVYSSEYKPLSPAAEDAEEE